MNAMASLIPGIESKALALFAFVVLLGVVITVHEWGHFAVARACGVRVLRFSIGFGKALWSRTGRDGTEYVVAAIPLGGYVKMLDEREGAVPPEQLHRAFNRKPVAQRFAIVAAGPLVNLALAFAVYWALSIAGGMHMAAIVGSVEYGSPAAAAGLAAGDEVLAVDGRTVTSWDDLPLQLVARVGDTGSVHFSLRSGAAGIERTVDVPVTTFMRGHEDDNPVDALGLRPWMPAYPVEVGEVMAQVDVEGGKVPGPGAVAGFRPGDRILRVDGHAIDNTPAWVDAVRAAPGRALAVDVARGADTVHLVLTPAARTVDGRTTGFAGIGSGGSKVNLHFPEDWPVAYVRHVRYSPLEAVGVAWRNTRDRAALTLRMIGKMLTGALSARSIGGPLTIAQGAGITMSIGPGAFLDFLALVSITIGILNLLPVPVLDGGHLLFYAIEAARGKPLPVKVQEVATRIGLFLLLLLMSFALFNDFMRYVAHP